MRRAMPALVVAALLSWIAGACRSDRRDATTPPTTSGDAAAASGGAAAKPSDAAEPAAAGRPLTEAECESLVDHVVQVGLRAHNETEAPEYRPTTEQVAQIAVDLRAELLPRCLTLDRAAWQCAMAAQDPAGLAACEPAP